MEEGYEHMSRIVEEVEISTTVRTVDGNEYLVYTHYPFRRPPLDHHGYYTSCQSLDGDFMFLRRYETNVDGAREQHYKMCNNLEEYIAKELADGDATL